MAFLEELKKNLSEVSSTVAKKSGDVLELQKAKMRKASIESDLKNLYAKLGKLCYENGEEADMAELRQRIATAITAVEEAEKRVASLKGEIICENCHAEIDRSAVYCPKCGAEVVHQEEADEEVEAETFDEADIDEDVTEDTADSEDAEDLEDTKDLEETQETVDVAETETETVEKEETAEEETAGVETSEEETSEEKNDEVDV